MFTLKTYLTLVVTLLLSATLSAKVVYVEYYPNGVKKMEIVKLKKGVHQVTKYYPSGQVFETGFSKRGMSQGQWTRYNQSGEVVATAFFKDNLKIGSWNHYNQWNQNTLKVSYMNGQPVSFREYDLAGNLIASGER